MNFKLWTQRPELPLLGTSSASLRSLMLLRNLAACTISAGPTMPGARKLVAGSPLIKFSWEHEISIVKMICIYIYIRCSKSPSSCLCPMFLCSMSVFWLCMCLFYVVFPLLSTWNQQTHAGIASVLYICWQDSGEWEGAEVDQPHQGETVGLNAFAFVTNAH